MDIKRVLLLALCALALAPVHSSRSAAHDARRPLPVVLWHGMGDSCCSLGSIGAIKKLLEDKLGVFVHSIATGEGEYWDIWSSFFGNINDQVTLACEQLRELDELDGGWNAVGFSQGGQFLRAVLERCGHELPPLHRLITMGAQHQGVMNVPGCRSDVGGAEGKACGVMQVLLARGAYAPWVRSNVIQAQYFKDPYALQQYMDSNIFLPDINNEKQHKSQHYVENMVSLDQLVLYRFANDTTVVPRDSAWFSFFNGTDLIPLKDQPLYQQDWIGLRQLDEAGKLLLEEAPGEHMQFTLKWFDQEVVRKYLAPPVTPSQQRSRSSAAVAGPNAQRQVVA